MKEDYDKVGVGMKNKILETLNWTKEQVETDLCLTELKKATFY